MKKLTAIFLAALTLAGAFFAFAQIDVQGAPEFTEDEKEADMQLKFTDDNMIEVFTKDSKGKQLITSFIHKPWSTWNLCDWVYDGMSITGGSTDWEYVYRAGPEGTWSGGNHGNEKMISIEFYDGITNEKFAPVKNKTYNTKCLKVVEKTKLHLGNENETYCDVTRNYTVIGNQITFVADYDFTTDMDFFLSYTCMFPVNKKFGRYIDFIDDESGYIETAVTSKVGKPDYSGPFYSGYKASVCEMYGKDYPEIRCIAEVMTPEDSLDNFKNTDKTFYWDMNTTHNKLYYSKFDNSAPQKVAKGTKWHTKSRWTLLTDYKEGDRPHKKITKYVDDSTKVTLPGYKAGEYGYAHYNAKLNDGITCKGISYDPDKWLGMYTSYSENKNLAVIQLDLGRECTFNELRAHIVDMRDASGISTPDRIYAEISNDGVNFEKLEGDLTYKPGSVGDTYWATLIMFKPVSARYVRFNYYKKQPSAFIVFTDEVEVNSDPFNTPNPIPAPKNEAFGLATNVLTVGKNIIKTDEALFTDALVSTEELLGTVLEDTSGRYVIKDKNGKTVTKNTKIVNGMTVEDKTFSQTRKIIVRYDINGDGRVTSYDAIAAKKHVLGLNKLSGDNLAALLCENKTHATAADALRIKKLVVLGK